MAELHAVHFLMIWVGAISAATKPDHQHDPRLDARGPGRRRLRWRRQCRPGLSTLARGS